MTWKAGGGVVSLTYNTGQNFRTVLTGYLPAVVNHCAGFEAAFCERSVSCLRNGGLFKYWVIFELPFHGLYPSDRHIELVHP